MLFLTSSHNVVVHDILKHLDRDPHQTHLTFVPTAAEDGTGVLPVWAKEDRQSLVDAEFIMTDFTFTDKKEADVQEMLDNTDVLFISGGNTFYLLQQMRKCGADVLIKKYVANGMPYIGSSAGSVVAGPNIEAVKELDDPKEAPELNDYTGLNLIDVVVFPHWGSEKFQNRYEKLLRACYKKGLKIILLTDDQYLLVEDDSYKIMSI